MLKSLCLAVLLIPCLLAGASAAQPADETYFPKEYRQRWPDCSTWNVSVIGDVEAEWFTTHWKAASEPSLYQVSQTGAPGGSTLRFTWLRSFHAPVFVRLETGPAGEMRLIAKQLTGKGGYEPGAVGKTVERILSSDEQAGLKAMLERTRLFELPPVWCGIGGTDGARWIFESAGPERYRLINWQSPQEGPMHEAGLFLLSLTGWKFEEIY